MKLRLTLLILTFGLISNIAIAIFAFNENNIEVVFISQNHKSNILGLEKLIVRDTIIPSEMYQEYPYYYFDNRAYTGEFHYLDDIIDLDTINIDIYTLRKKISKQNISVSVNYALDRNTKILYNSFIACGFFDSLIREDILYWGLHVHSDSTGSVNKLSTMKLKNSPWLLNEQRFEMVRSYMDSCGLLMTKIIEPYHVQLFYCAHYNFEAESLLQIQKIIPNLNPTPLLLRPYNGHIHFLPDDYFRNSFEMLLGDHPHYNSTIPLPEINIPNYNDAVFGLSMIYVFGDHAMDFYSKEYNFSFELKLDNNGHVAELVAIHGNSPFSDSEISRLMKFIVKNKIEFIKSSSDNSGNIMLNFPDACYCEELKPMQYYRRINVHETMIRTIIHKYICSRGYPCKICNH